MNYPARSIFLEQDEDQWNTRHVSALPTDLLLSVAGPPRKRNKKTRAAKLTGGED
jgi:hypothetical protein